jgi:hypothetical protein
MIALTWPGADRVKIHKQCVETRANKVDLHSFALFRGTAVPCAKERQELPLAMQTTRKTHLNTQLCFLSFVPFVPFCGHSFYPVVGLLSKAA